MNVPINAITWTIGAIAYYAYAARSWASYHAAKNPLAHIYFWMTLIFGTAFLLFGAPALLFIDPLRLRVTYVLADVFVQAGMQTQVWLMWFIRFRNRFRLRHMLALSMTFSAILLIIEAATSTVSIQASPYLVIYADKPIVLILKSIIYLSVAMPLGYFFVRQAPAQPSLRGRLLSLLTGFIFLGVGLSATSNNIFDRGSDTLSSALVTGGIFVVTFILCAFPRRWFKRKRT